MRLIDADALISKIWELHKKTENHMTCALMS